MSEPRNLSMCTAEAGAYDASTINVQHFDRKGKGRLSPSNPWLNDDFVREMGYERVPPSQEHRRRPSVGWADERAQRRPKHEQYIRSDGSESDDEVKLTRVSPTRNDRHPFTPPKYQDDADNSDDSVQLEGRGFDARTADRERAQDAPGLHDRTHSRGREATGLVRLRQAKDQGANLKSLTGQPMRYSGCPIQRRTLGRAGRLVHCFGLVPLGCFD